MAQILILDAYRPFPPPAAALALPAPAMSHARIFALGVLIGATVAAFVWAVLT
jgi:hypothetical protein